MTWTVILPLLLKAWPVILGVLGWLGARFYYMRKGAEKERAKQAQADKRANDIADEVQSDVGSMSPEQIDAELRRRAPK